MDAGEMGSPGPFVRRSVLFVATLALAMLPSQGSVGQTTVTNVNRNDSILTSYEVAFNRAGQEGKPIFVLFTSQSQPAELQTLQSQGLLNDYLVVVADRNTDEGRKVFAAFNWTANDGVSVIERNRQWQFARYERKLDTNELAQVANSCRFAVGYPTFDALANVSAYQQ